MIQLGEMEIQAREKDRLAIIHHGLKPKTCPTCGFQSLWPKSREEENSLSREDNKTRICSPCGIDEVFPKTPANAPVDK